ncbi:MAG TPA: DUF4389 domain-containing protein, partial [Acidimicrobiales bacterium]|nr:DUF4389 domain-containing protein [Acidimicrobiales bacterium]
MATAAPTLVPRVEAGFGSPARQNRWTVAFRLILAIPQFVVTWFLGIVALVLVFLGWFAALVTGRFPRAFLPFVTAFIQYQTRVFAYATLLTDAYPPFSFEAPYPVNVDVTPTPVRRLAVLFRIILYIPANIVLSLATSGMSVTAIVVWLIVLINGSMPPALFWAVAAVLRFQARAYAYLFMVSAKYPGELFGDTTYAIGTDAPAVPSGRSYRPAHQPHYGAPPPPRRDTGPAATQPATPAYPTGVPAGPAGHAPPPVDAPAPGPSEPGARAPYQPPPPMYFGPPPTAGVYVDPAGAP